MYIYIHVDGGGATPQKMVLITIFMRWSSVAAIFFDGRQKMSVFQVKVKWGKKKFEDLELSTEEPPLVFKCQLFDLTNVPPERQKLMLGGATIGDQEWGKAQAKIKDGCTLLMMGSSEALPQAPAEKTKFMEDMTEAEAAVAMEMPSGLRNLGNTCYMNSTVQCLKAVPELCEALVGVPQSMDSAGGGHDPQKLTVALLTRLYMQMDRHQPDLSLTLFLQQLHTLVPHFADRDERSGAYKQQDAHECWQAIVTALSLHVPGNEGGGRSFMEQFFGVKLQSKLQCVELPEEKAHEETENVLQLTCFIQADIKYLFSGLDLGLKGEVEKYSSLLDRDAVYHKESRISRLPAYLVIQYMRFFVGRAGASEEIVAKKVLKDVKFTMNLDVYSLCTSELQEKLAPMRERLKEFDDRKAKGDGKFKSKDEVKEKQKEAEYEPFDFPDDPGSNNSGHYELQAVLTHRGRSSSSGHYVAWAKTHKRGWLQFDDDVVTPMTEEDILKLSGGGDWHMAYILLYGPRRLEKTPQ